MLATQDRKHPSLAPMSRDYRTPSGLQRTTFAAMGTTVELLLPESQAAVGSAAVQVLFAAWEQQLSRFLPESELSLLNARAGQAVPVSALLYTVLTTALSAADATNGIYDPTLQRTMVAIGYDRSFEQIEQIEQIERIERAGAQVATDAAAPVARALAGGGWRRVRVDRSDRRVTLPAEVGLDLGGIAKGMAVDAALARLSALGIANALVNAGGDLAVRGQPPDGDSWPVAVPGREMQWTLPLRAGALATSGIARRRWQHGGQQRHHLIDPRTGAPATSDLWAVTVLADRCEQAEVAAKVAYVLGMERGATFLRKHRLAGLLVGASGDTRSVEPWPAATLPRAAAEADCIATERSQEQRI